ncbi:hypothetical protein FQA39_LY01572 [Lamprigera yunnana]|nr:hypothetical protein FQA39_LY01572 [Lamprigera yunnana]
MFDQTLLEIDNVTMSSSRNSRKRKRVPKGCSTPKPGQSEPLFLNRDLSNIETSSISSIDLTESLASDDGLSEKNCTFELSHRKRKNITPFFNNLNFSLDVHNRDDSSTFYDSFKGVKAKYRKGQHWNWFKPKRTEGIYHEIEETGDYKAAAEAWMNMLESDPNEALMVMLQFTVDICGFQDLDLSNKVDLNDAMFNNVVDYMEKNPPKVQIDTGKYLFKVKGVWVEYIEKIIQAFMQEIVVVAYKKNVLKSTHMAQLIVWLWYLNQSANRSLHHTTAIIAIKMNTAFHQLWSKIYGSTVGIGKEHDLWLRLIINRLQYIIVRSCEIEDPQLYLVKVACAEEVILWLQYGPRMNYTTYWRLLKQLIDNDSKTVRQTAIKTCHQLITINEVLEKIRPFLESFSKVIGRRVYDVDYDIAISSVKIYTKLLTIDKTILENDICYKIMSLIFGKHSLLAMAAGEFFVKYFDDMSDPSNLINKMVTYIHRKKKNEWIGLLVEATYDCCPPVRNWKLLIDLLMNNVEPTYSEILAGILFESVQQGLFGKSKIIRMKAYERENKVNCSEASNLLIEFLPNLLKKYNNHPVCLQQFVEILLITSLNDTIYSTKEILDLVCILRNIFVRNTEEKLLESISKCFHQISAENVTYKCTIQKMQIHIKDAVEQFMAHLKKEDVQDWMVRLLSLLMHHDATDGLSATFFIEIVNVMMENNFNANTISYTLKSCQHYIKWQLKSIIVRSADEERFDPFQESIQHVKKMIEEFKNCCFNILDRSQDYNLNFSVVECICDAFFTFKITLEEPLKTNKELAILVPSIDDPRHIIQITNKVQTLLFENCNESNLMLRRRLLVSFLNIIHLNIIGIVESVKLYQHYHSHQKDFKDIFNLGLKQIQEVNSIAYAGIIIQSLIYKFTHYLLILGKNLNTSTAFVDLKNLAKGFQALLNDSPQESLLLLEFGLKYALSSKDRYIFLDIIKYFSKPLSKKDKKSLVTTIKSVVSMDNAEAVHIKVFIQYLETNTSSKCEVKALPPVAETVEESIEIIDDSDYDSKNHTATDP